MDALRLSGLARAAPSPPRPRSCVRHLAKGTARRRAAAALARPPRTSPLSPRSQRGELTEAAAPGCSDRPRRRGAPAVVAGEVGLLTPAARRRPVAPPARGRRVLHLVTNALPETVAGYTRPHPGIARAQRAARARRRTSPPGSGSPSPRGTSARAARRDRRRDRVTTGCCPPGCRCGPTRALAAGHRRSPPRLVASLRPGRAARAQQPRERPGRRWPLRERVRASRCVYEVRGFLEETWRSRSTDPDAGSATPTAGPRPPRRSACARPTPSSTLSEVMRAEIVARGVDPADGSRWSPTASTLAPGGGRRRGARDGTAGRAAHRRDRRHAQRLRGHRRAGRRRRPAAAAGGTTYASGWSATAPSAPRWRSGPPTAASRTPPPSPAGCRTHEVVAQHRAIDVFCVPRHDLPVTRLVPPLKPVEAMALGRPVVASDLPPLREIVTDGRARPGPRAARPRRGRRGARRRPDPPRPRPRPPSAAGRQRRRTGSPGPGPGRQPPRRYHADLHPHPRRARMTRLPGPPRTSA